MSDQVDSHENDKDEVDAEEVVDETLAEEGGDAESEETMDLPTALAELEVARRKIREVNRESAGRRKEIGLLKGQLDTFTRGGDDTVKKVTELQEQLRIANESLRTHEMRERFDTVAAKARIPFANATASHDAFVFARDAMSKLPDDASDEDLLDLVQDVVKARPYLLNKPTTKNINAEARGTSDAFTGLNLDDIARDFGINKR